MNKEREMIMKKKLKKVNVNVTFTEGYEKRFTEVMLKIYEKRKQATGT